MQATTYNTKQVPGRPSTVFTTTTFLSMAAWQDPAENQCSPGELSVCQVTL